MPHQAYIGSDGKPWPSATELTSIIPQPWILSWYRNSVFKYGKRGWQKNLATSNRGMKIGSLVHGMIEAYITKAPAVPYDQKYGADRIADALYDKVNPMVQDYIEIEPKVVSERLKIHGTADAIVRLEHGEGLAVLDWKTGASRSETHPIQLACYSLAWNETHPGLQVDKGIIARVDKKTKALNVHIDTYAPLSQYYPVVQALRTIWAYQND
jgi:hypothetical protein